MDLCDSQLPLVENEVLNLSDFGHDNEGMFKVINFKYFLRLILNIKYNRIPTVPGKISKYLQYLFELNLYCN